MSSTPADPVPQPPARRSSYANGTAMNMVRSMLVLTGLVLLIVLVVPRTNTISRAGLDVPGEAQAQADRAARVLSYPTGLPSGWTPSAVRYTRSTDGLMMWHCGFTTPENDFVAVQQVEGATDNWVEAQVQRSPQAGTWKDARGRVWQRYDRKDKVQHSLVLRDEKGTHRRTSLVTGTGTWQDVETFTNALTEAKPQGMAGGSSPTS